MSKIRSKFKKITTLSLRCITLIIICQAFLPISSASAASYSANRFYFKDFTADYYLSRAEDGTSRLRVVEQLTVVFPNSDQNHGITRVIPYTNQDGKNLTMISDDYLEINLWHNGVEERPHSVEGGDGFFTVYIGDASKYVHGTHTYVLEYEFRNVITAFTDDGRSWQELYWDTNGNDWSQKFEQLTARLHFEDETITTNFTGETSCYVGRYGASGSSRCKTSKIDDGIQFTASNLSAGENLTFDVEFKPDTFKLGRKHYDYRLVIALGAELIFITGMGITLFVLYRQTAAKRQYYKGLFIKPEYTPPRGITVAAMAENYIGKGITGSSKVATLMELAVNHKINLIKRETTKPSGKKGKTTWVIKVLSVDLSADQVTALKILKGDEGAISVGQEIEVKSHTANSTLVKLGEAYNEQARVELRRQGLAEYNPAKNITSSKAGAKNPCNTLIAIASVWLFAGIFCSIFIFEDIPSYYTLVGGDVLIIPIILLFILSFVGTLIICSKISPYYNLTKKGLEYSRYLDGLKLYIKMAEKDRLAFLQSVDGADVTHEGVVKVYEKLLPYAVLFKLEKSWLQEMAHYYEFDDVANPTWYVGVGVFSAHEFSTALAAASSTLTTTTSHSTSSNSSSGFSGGGGGGFSGGGGGGGGGGGW